MNDYAISRQVDIVLPKLQPYQKEVLDYIQEHRGHFAIVKAVRQCGKSFMVTAALIRASLENRHQTSIVVTPTYKQGLETFKRIVKSCSGYCGGNSSLMTITFLNGSQIIFLSAQQGEALRGYTVTKYGLLVYDEAAYINDETYFTTLSFANANDATVLITSTPRFRKGVFYECYTKALTMNLKNARSFDWAKIKNPYITEDRLNTIRQNSPPLLFACDYLGEFVSDVSELFGELSLSTIRPSYKRLTMGIDWATGSGKDSTAITLFNERNEMAALWYFNDLDAQATIEFIKGKITEYPQVDRVIVETNSIGKVYCELLEKAIDRHVIKFNTTNESKRKIVESMIVKNKNKEVVFLEDPELVLQFGTYEIQQTGSGKITYNAQIGYHDDIVMSCAMALYANSSGGYSYI